MNSSIDNIKTNLRRYKKKYYTNQLIKGVIFFLSLSITAFIVFTVLEYFGNFNTIVRTSIFYTYIAIAGFGLIKWIGLPIKHLLNIDQELSDEDAAKQIGDYFPEIKDKLLNTIQLSKLGENNSLISASIAQRSESINTIPFQQAVEYGKNKKYFNKYMLIPLLLLLVIFIAYAKIFTESTHRIVQYNTEFIPKAPFNFVLKNDSLSVFRNEEFTVKLSYDGDQIPSQTYINIDEEKFLMIDKKNEFIYHFSNISQAITFNFEGARFSSKHYTINVIDRPLLSGLKVSAQYPKYLNIKPKTYNNTGSFTIPEGTVLKWDIKAKETTGIKFILNNKPTDFNFQKQGENFSFDYKIKSGIDYEIILQNQRAKNKNKLVYHIDVIKDEYPVIKVEQIKDTIFYNNIMVAGSISDDYGLSSLSFVYKTKSGKYESKAVSIRKGGTSQSFFYQANINELGIKNGANLEYYFMVVDNDGVNGKKRTKSKFLTFVIPSKEDLKEKIDKEKKELNKAYNKSLKKSKSLKQQVTQLSNQLKSKKKLDWQDKADIQKLLDKHKSLKKDLDQQKAQQELTREKEEQLSEEEKKLLDKMKQLDELMKNMMDKEFQKMLDELEKMIQENTSDEDIRKKLDELEQKDESLEQQLDRNIEMMKKFELEQKLENIKSQLEKLAKKQEKLAKETKNNKNLDKKEDLLEKQKELSKEFKDIQKDYKKAKELNKEMLNQQKMDDFSKEEESIEKNQEKSEQELGDNKQKDASESQQKAAQKMKEMGQKLGKMMKGMQSEQLEENMEDLKALLENLINLSFGQEELMNEFRSIRQRDPRFIELSQEQIKLNNDSQIIKDSLLALAKRVPKIEIFVIDEVNNMSRYMKESSQYIKNRIPHKAAAKQQYSMSSANNLAVMISDILKNMQMQMAQQQSNKPGSSMCTKPGGTKPSNSGMKKQMKAMAKMMQDIKDGKKSGRGLSKKLAEMAARQEMMRQAYQKMQQENGKEAGGNKAGDKLKEAINLMKQNENDIINNKISQKTIQRQQQILTRLLEYENADKERDKNNKREAVTAKQKIRKQPDVIKQFLKEKKKQIELLKTIPPDLRPYYRKKINKYLEGIQQ